MTGDVTPDLRAIGAADLIVTTPEKWDGVSRSWQTRSYVKSVALLVIDEIHLLGESSVKNLTNAIYTCFKTKYQQQDNKVLI